MTNQAAQKKLALSNAGILIYLSILSLVACTSSPTVAPVASPPTATPEAVASATLSPTHSSTPPPTNTPEPTPTPTTTPTNTPAPPTPTPTPLVLVAIPEGVPHEQLSYLMSLLEEHGFQTLALELRRLPELQAADTNTVEAVTDIVDLALNATVPEVAEAFEWILADGNLWKLRVLYQMALTSEFEHNDRLALMVANEFGYWALITTENPEIPLQDAVMMLEQGRQASQLQESLGWTYNLSSLDNCSLAVWAWTGNYSASGGRVYPLRWYPRLPVEGYLWNTVDVERTLPEMRQMALEQGWVGANPTETIGRIEYYFYFDRGPQGGNSSHWQYASDANGHRLIDVEGREVANHDLNNVDFIWDHYVRTGKGIGECGDNTILIEAIAKSLGIPVTEVIRQATDSQRVLDSHMFPLFRGLDGWTAYDKELNIGSGSSFNYTVYIGRPPINHLGYLNYWLEEPHRVRWFGNMYYVLKDQLTIADIRETFGNGVLPDTMQGWLCTDQLER